jgi:putative tricarboxylic transport membrane protein
MKGDRLAALVILLGGLAYVREAFAYSGAVVGDVVGPMIYPVLLGVLILILAVFLFLGARPQRVEGTFWSLHARPLFLSAGILAYVVLMDSVGFVLTTVVFLAVGTAWLGEHSWPKSIGLAVGLTGVLWYVFNRIFELNLPAGLLGRLG